MSNYKDLTGQVFNRLTVIKSVGKDKHNSILWLCKCSCGNFIKVRGYDLKSGHTKSCGCYNKECKHKREYLIGKKFNKLTVIEDLGIIGKESYSLCKCDCGNITKVRNTYLKNGYTKSCGCIKENSSNYKHGKYKTRVYRIWRGMKGRCYNKGNGGYKYYGARGITVCQEWLDKNDGFENFYKWAIENGYNDNLSIDRINPSGNYEPNNCRWSTNLVQENNKTSNRYIYIDGVKKSLADWCRDYEVSYKCVSTRIHKGWDPITALVTPSKNLKEWWHN